MMSREVSSRPTRGTQLLGKIEVPSALRGGLNARVYATSWCVPAAEFFMPVWARFRSGARASRRGRRAKAVLYELSRPQITHVTPTLGAAQTGLAPLISTPHSLDTRKHALRIVCQPSAAHIQ
jgi:hypothetical protein